MDAAPLALYNSVRFNCPEADGCTLVLDIGARATNLVFVEGSKVFMRTIPIAGNTVTNEIARGLGVEPAEAEALKKEIGFVALGGTYALPDDERDLGIEADFTTESAAEHNRKVIAQCIRELPSPDREIFIDRFYYSLSFAAIADRHSITVKRAEYLIHKAKRRLRKALEEGGILL